MKVAIVDDEIVFRNTLKEYIERFSEEKGIRMEVEEFVSADNLLAVYRTQFDIIVLDIDLPGTNGMEAAKRIRQKDQGVVLFFITNIAQYAINGYDVEAAGYMVKPLEYYDFLLKFSRAAKRAMERGNYEIIIDTVDGQRKVKVSDILYIEIFSHYLIYHLLGGECKGRGKISEQEELLAPYYFCRVHKSFLVNLRYVNTIRYNKLEVGKEWLPIGRNYRDSVMREYMRSV